MLSSKLSILRLRRFERECSDGSDEASDPLTKREMREFEQIFRRMADDRELAERLAE
jgi:ribosomal protein RSM22 (predicted rRNA methylase)